MNETKKTLFNEPIDWDRSSQLFSRAIGSQSDELQLKAVTKLAVLSNQAPESILTPTIPILIDLLNSPKPRIQEAAAFALCCLARRTGGTLSLIIGQFGAIPPILRLLPDSSNQFRRTLLRCLSSLVVFNDANRVILTRHRGLDIILEAISSCNDSNRRYLLEILTALALVREARRAVVSRGGLPFIVEGVANGKMVSRLRAAQVIGLLGVLKRVRRLLVDLGAIQALVGLLRDGDASGRIIAGNALGIISCHVDCIRLVAQAGAIPLYVELFRGNDSLGKEIAEDVFCVLAVDEENALSIAEYMVRVLKGDEDEDAKGAALDVIWGLSGYRHSSSVVENSGMVGVLIELLENGSSDLREKASGVIAQLSYEQENRRVMVEEGAIPVLINLLRGNSEELREYAAESLINFAHDWRYQDSVSEAFEIPSFLVIQDRLRRIRASEEQMARSMRSLSAEHFTSDLEFF